MSIPKYNEIMPNVLRYLAEHGEQKFRELEQPLAIEFGLSDDEIAQEYDSGNGTVFLDRISWALSYLTNSGLTERPRRGVYKITDTAQKFLDKSSEEIQQFVKAQMALRTAEQKAIKIEQGFDDDRTELLPTSNQTPQEMLNTAYKSIRQSTYDQIIDTVLSKTPSEFEGLVVKLLERMGYGGEVKNAGTVTQASNDGGIDGIIKEDILGLGKIHIQAKRYARSNTVGREEVQKFVGALAVAQSNKGVFITTSSYSAGAIAYAESLNGTTNLVLINGEQLAKYMYDYSLGMQTKQHIEIKEMDSDFWDGMQNDSKIS
ncbi:restriction endonuclease [Neptuniibacter sp. 2_MG-2023]|uniref:restriction endonuclease n=1 Tax=Neptuniibacter sp. 2_MG-2023 TaxID=3062671 RepID=UPI0026E23C3F|nr:restriction endonuclease [Neptuniibacter sp. 2_MG-2023]MDO6514409.1 restriction endonuclease [Neptuniibacter sp. 2_MG-2023]